MRRLLVASDLTQGSLDALARAIRLALPTAAAIRIVHAVDRSETPEQSIAIRNRILTEARVMIDEMVGREMELSIAMSDRDPGHAIVREAEEFDADLILLGGHGEPRLRDALFGTTGSHVVRHSTRPVLVVQTGDAPAYAKVMVGLEDSALASLVLDCAVAIAPAAEIFAVQVCDPPPSPLFDIGDRERGTEVERQARLDVHIRQSLAGRDSAQRPAIHGLVRTGDVSTVLLAHYFELAPDLVAMGIHRRSALLASHAIDALDWCRCDVLIVPDSIDARLVDGGPTPIAR